MSNSIEHDNQVQYIRWCKHQRIDLMHSKFYQGFAAPLETIFDFIHAVPNGGKREQKVKVIGGKRVNYSPEGGRLKAEGVKAGVSDLNLSIPAHGFTGLYMELKKPVGRDGKAPTIPATQKEFSERMKRAGYQVAFCWGYDQLVDATVAYLTGDLKKSEMYSVPKYKREQ